MGYSSEDIVNKALEFAKNAHKGQKRKGKMIDYIEHPIAVYKLIREYTDDVEVHCAALLHDVIEDTDVTYEELVEKFGKSIADVVLEVSDSKEDKKNLSWMERRQRSIQKIKLLSEKAIIVELGDKIHNATSLLELPKKAGIIDFSNFHEKNPQKQEWYYRNMCEAFQHNSKSENICKLSNLLSEKIDCAFEKTEEEYKRQLLDFRGDDNCNYDLLRILNYWAESLQIELNRRPISNPVIIEFFGTPGTEKSAIVEKVSQLLKEHNIKTGILDNSCENKEEVMNVGSLEQFITKLENKKKSDLDILFVIDGLMNSKILSSRDYFAKKVSIYDEVEMFDMIKSKEDQLIDGAFAIYEDSSMLLKDNDNIDRIESYNDIFLEANARDFDCQISHHVVCSNNLNSYDISLEAACFVLSTVENTLAKRDDKLLDDDVTIYTIKRKLTN